MFARRGLFPRAACAFVCAAATWAVGTLPAAADDKNGTAANGDRGTLVGCVVDAATGKPVAGATVALREGAKDGKDSKDGKVLAWAKTDAQGRYALIADPLAALRLRPSRHRGLLERVARGVGNVVTTPVKIVAETTTGAVKAAARVDPVETGKAALISAATANPTPAAVVVGTQVGQAVSGQATASAREGAAKAALGERRAAPKEDARGKPVLPAHGTVCLSVAAPGYKELPGGAAGMFWLEPATPTAGVRAWLATVKLAPAGAPADKPSGVEEGVILLADGRADPALAPAGSSVRLSVTLNVPAAPSPAGPGDVPPVAVRVFAREERKGAVVELTPRAGTPGVFAGDLSLDAGLRPGETVVTLVALRAEPVEVKLNRDKGDPLLEFARGLDDLEAGKAYEFDPRIMASANRLDLPITILDPKKAAPPAPPAPPTPPSAPQR